MLSESKIGTSISNSVLGDRAIDPRHLIVALLLFISACTSQIKQTDRLDVQRPLIEISDLYLAGHEQVATAIKSLPEIGTMLDTNLAAALLITLVIEYEDGERERIQQSGCFVLDGQYILTAAHGFYVEGGKLIGLEAQTIKRQRVDLSVVAMGYSTDESANEDWAILQLLDQRPSPGLAFSRSGHTRGEVFVLGFPGGLALNDSNEVVHALEVEAGSTYPLAIICERSLSRPNILTPRVGAIPIRGMSGAPVLSTGGELIGMFSSISRTRGVTGWYYIFHMSDLPLVALDSLTKK